MSDLSEAGRRCPGWRACVCCMELSGGLPGAHPGPARPCSVPIPCGAKFSPHGGRGSTRLPVHLGTSSPRGQRAEAGLPRLGHPRDPGPGPRQGAGVFRRPEPGGAASPHGTSMRLLVQAPGRQLPVGAQEQRRPQSPSLTQPPGRQTVSSLLNKGSGFVKSHVFGSLLSL